MAVALNTRRPYKFEVETILRLTTRHLLLLPLSRSDGRLAVFPASQCGSAVQGGVIVDHDQRHLGSNMARVEAALLAHEQAFGAATIPCYGLPPDWQGFRTLGANEIVVGTGLALGPDGDIALEDRYETWELIHGAITTAGPYLAVETTNAPTEERPALAEKLSAILPGTPGRSVDALTLDVEVDGRPCAFSGLRSGDCWVAHHALVDHRITIVACRIAIASPRLQLVTIEDLGPYFIGRRSLLPPNS
jgi:hypothetical protein